MLGKFVFNPLTQKNLGDGLAWYRPLVEPVFDALVVEHDLLRGVFFDWVVMTELLDDSVVRGNRVLQIIEELERTTPLPEDEAR